MLEAASLAGVLPRALAMTLVLPKKRLCIIKKFWSAFDGIGEMGKFQNGPAIRELGSDVFEEVIAHVVD